MTAFDLVALAVQLGAATALIVAAAAKAGAPARLADTITALGLRPAAPLARVVVAAELAAATALAVHPASPITATLVVTLGSAFAGAGLIAHRRGVAVSCACFGGHTGRPLGLRQVAAWPLWSVVAVLAAASPLTGADGLLGLAAVGTAAGLALGGPVLAATWRSRGTPAVAR